LALVNPACAAALAAPSDTGIALFDPGLDAIRERDH
jgi:hypothetical protein